MCWLPVGINNNKLFGLCDSGSSTNLLSSKLALKLGLTVVPDGKFLRLADGKLMPTTGVACVNLLINGSHFSCWFCVCDLIHFPIILGLPFLSQAGVKLDFVRNCFSISRGKGKWFPFPSESEVSKFQDTQGSCLAVSFEEADLTISERAKLRELLDEFPEVFTGIPGECTLPPIKLELKPGSTAVRSLPFRFSGVRLEQMRKHIDEMLEQGIIEPAYSSYASPVFLVPKANSDKTRMVVDFRKVNEQLVFKPYPVPTISQQLSALDGKRIFSTLDLCSGYHQLRLDPTTADVTTFTSPFGNYRYKRLAQGLSNGVGEFQNAMDQILGPLKWRSASPYLDDLIVYSTTFEEHLVHLREVLSLLKQYGLTVNQEKCHFGMRQVKYLGHIIGAEGIRPDPSYVEAVSLLNPPTNRKELQRFLGKFCWVGKFIDHFASIARPLFQLLKKGCKWVWEPDHQKAFLDLKGKLVSKPILAHPNLNKPYVVMTDASAVGLSGILLQKGEDGLEHPIAYASRATTPLEAVRASVDLELTAVFFAYEKFRPFLEGTHFTLRTDAAALTWLRNLKNPSGRLGRWSLTLQELDFDVEHIRGRDNTFADALSRQPLQRNEPVVNVLTRGQNSAWAKWEKEVRDAQLQDDYCKAKFQDASNSSSSPFVVIDGILYKFAAEGWADPNPYKLVIPKSLVLRILEENHSVPNAGHQGVFRTVGKLKRTYFWPSLLADAKDFVVSCPTCQATKPDLSGKKGFTHSLESQGPWDTLYLDFIGPLPVSSKGNAHILVVVDAATRWTEVYPLRNANSASVVRCLRELFNKLGAPRRVVFDNGTPFKAALTQRELWCHGVQPIFITPFHPSANLSERFNQQIKRMIRAFVGEFHKGWDKHLSEFQLVLNASVNVTLGVSAAELFLGRPLFTLFDRLCQPGKKQIPVRMDSSLKEQRLDHWIHLWALADRRQADKLAKYRKTADAKASPANWKVGDLVGVKTHFLSDANKSFAQGLAPKWSGPWRVESLQPGDVARLKHLNTEEKAIRHISQTKPWKLRQLLD